MVTTVGDDLDTTIKEHSEWFEMKPSKEPSEEPRPPGEAVRGSPLLREIAMETGTTQFFGMKSSHSKHGKNESSEEKSSDLEKRSDGGDSEHVSAKDVARNRQAGASDVKTLDTQLSVSSSSESKESPNDQPKIIPPLTVTEPTGSTERILSDLKYDEDDIPAPTPPLKVTQLKSHATGESKPSPYSLHTPSSSGGKTRSSPSNHSKPPLKSSTSVGSRGVKEATKPKTKS